MSEFQEYNSVGQTTTPLLIVECIVMQVPSCMIACLMVLNNVTETGTLQQTVLCVR